MGTGTMMVDNFEKDDGRIRVRTPKGAIRPVKTPRGFSDHVFRNVLAATDTLFRQNGELPSVDEVQAMWPNASMKTISALMVTDEFRQAMDYRGIQWNVDSGLSEEQQFCILKLNDPGDRRSRKVKLQELGIPMSRFQAWLKWPMFAEALRKGAEDNLKEAIPMAINTIVAEAEVNYKAAEKVLEITGRYDPNNRQMEDLRLLVTRLVEAVTKHTTPEQRAAILSDFGLHAAMIVDSDRQQIGG